MLSLSDTVSVSIDYSRSLTQIFSLGFNLIKSRADNYMCKFAFEKAVEQLLNHICLIKILIYPIANRFIVYRIE